MPGYPLTLPPLSLYIHIPWCVRKCPYCDFNSHQADDNLPEQRYTDLLINDLDNDLPYTAGRPLHSIFFGGGTPSLFSSQAIARILQAARRRFDFVDDIEITLEANPGTFEQEKFEGYREAGINRLSIGIQSFGNAQLQSLGRIHSAEEAIAAVATARRAGFDNINLDLMHGLPRQTEQQALVDLQQAIDLSPEHLSWYQLTIEPNTAFYHQPPILPVEDVLDTIQKQGHKLLAENNYCQYEVSAYARDGKTSAHNLNYWQFGDYIGIGAGAHGKFSMPELNQVIRTRKTRTPKDYMAREVGFIAEQKAVSESEMSLEFFMNALRLNNGVASHLFSERTGLDFQHVQSCWDNLQLQGLVDSPLPRLKTTAKGHQFLNLVLEKLA